MSASSPINIDSIKDKVDLDKNKKSNRKPLRGDEYELIKS